MFRYPLTFILLLCGCSFEPDQSAKFFPVDLNELIYNKGDCLTFKIDSATYIAAIMVDFSKDEDGVWYGFCFTDYLDTIIPSITTIKSKKLFGRKVQSTLEDSGYFIGLDLEFLLDSCVRTLNEKIKLIGNLKLDAIKLRLGAKGATSNYSAFIESFRYGRERRLSPPDDYRKHFKLEKFRPDEYFPVRIFIVD